MLSVAGGVPVNNEAPVMTLSISRFASPTLFFRGAHSVVTSSISRFASPTLFFRGAHRGKVCVRAWIYVLL
jgi:hypothetical protein